MIENLSIKNFKSMKDISIECKRINLFIGEPNAGKSNILEALGVMRLVQVWRASQRLCEISQHYEPFLR